VYHGNPEKKRPLKTQSITEPAGILFSTFELFDNQDGIRLSMNSAEPMLVFVFGIFILYGQRWYAKD